MAARVKVFFDGGYRPKGQGMELAVVIGGHHHIVRDLGPGTSMEAEWLALLRARTLVRDLAIGNAVLVGDALAVIAQANGKTKCPAPYRRHLQAWRAIEEDGGRCRVRYAKRTQNLAGIALAKLHAASL